MPILVSQTHRESLRIGTNSPRWALLGRTESPAAWKREKGPESAQVASGMLNPWPVCLFGLWEPLKVARTAGSLSPRREATNKQVHVATGQNSGNMA